MADYQFKCPNCKKITFTESTSDEYPEYNQELECLSCKNKVLVKSSCLNLFVETKQEKKDEP